MLGERDVAAREWQVRRKLPSVDGELSHRFGSAKKGEKEGRKVQDIRNLGGTLESFSNGERLAVEVFAVLKPSLRWDDN